MGAYQNNTSNYKMIVNATVAFGIHRAQLSGCLERNARLSAATKRKATLFFALKPLSGLLPISFIYTHYRHV